MRRPSMEVRDPRYLETADDLDDISTLVNLLELRSLLRNDSNLESELD